MSPPSVARKTLGPCRRPPFYLPMQGEERLEALASLRSALAGDLVAQIHGLLMSGCPAEELVDVVSHYSEWWRGQIAEAVGEGLDRWDILAEAIDEVRVADWCPAGRPVVEANRVRPDDAGFVTIGTDLVPIVQANSDGQGRWRIVCRHCRRVHTHTGLGRRHAHCGRSGSPYERSGYILAPRCDTHPGAPTRATADSNGWLGFSCDEGCWLGTVDL